MELHKKLMLYKPEIHTSELRSIDKYFVTHYDKNGNILIRSFYIFLGSFDGKKNIWVWGNNHMAFNKLMSEKINIIREKINNKFTQNDFSTLSFDELIENLIIIEKILGKSITAIYSSNIEGILKYLLIEKIILNNLDE